MITKENFTKIGVVALGVVAAAVILFGLYTLHQDHKQLNAVVTFLQEQIQASQKAQAPASSVTK